MTKPWSTRWYSLPANPSRDARLRPRRRPNPGVREQARLGLGLLLLCASLSVHGDPLFRPFVASFSVARGIMPLGELELSFSLDSDGVYAYRARTQPGMLVGWFSGEEITEESHGRLNADALTPDRYLYRQEPDAGENTRIRFDWDAAKAYTTSGGITWAQSIEPGVQDRLSQQLAIRLHLAQGKRSVEYQVADGGKLKRYSFQVVGEESLKTPIGKLDCLKVERSKEGRPADYTIWFAPALEFLPVKIERQQSGKRYRMVLDEVEGIAF